MKICLVLGTRPEIIKMAPIIKELEKEEIDFFVIHTGQHYNYLMDKIFFEELSLAPKMINLNICSGLHGKMTGKMLIGIEKVLLKQKPDFVLVQGDTNSSLAGALAAVKLHIKVGHIEAGLRSYDKRMPEEYNRIIIDHIADYLFAPTKRSAKILEKEGVPKKQIYVVGNTIVDSLYNGLEIARATSETLNKLKVPPKKYFLLTTHREENVEDRKFLNNILKIIKLVSEKMKFQIIFPIHPRTRKKIKEFGLEKELSKIEGLTIIDPIGFLDMITLEKNSKLILTDSGGIQEEACILGVPCIVLRKTSDRPESIKVGASLLTGCEIEKITKAIKRLIRKKKTWKNPFGDGKAATKIVDIILRRENGK